MCAAEYSRALARGSRLGDQSSLSRWPGVRVPLRALTGGGLADKCFVALGQVDGLVEVSTTPRRSNRGVAGSSPAGGTSREPPPPSADVPAQCNDGCKYANAC